MLCLLGTYVRARCWKYRNNIVGALVLVSNNAQEIFQLKSRGNSFRKSIFPWAQHWEFSFFQKLTIFKLLMKFQKLLTPLNREHKKKGRRKQFQQNWTANSPVIVFEQSNFIVSPLFQLPFPIFIMFLMFAVCFFFFLFSVFFRGTLFSCFLSYSRFIITRQSCVNVRLSMRKVERSAGASARKTLENFCCLLSVTLFHSLFVFNSRQLLDAKKLSFFLGKN